MAAGDERSRNQIAATRSHNSRTSLIGSRASNKPIGTRLFGLCFQFSTPQDKRTFHKALVLTLTFIAYAAFHMGRRPLSIVKNVLNRNCSALPNGNITTELFANQHQSIFLGQTNVIQLEVNGQDKNSTSVPSIPLINNTITATIAANNSNCTNWAPFDDDTTANQLLAYLDTAFLLAYATFMFVSGVVAERVNLRYFISLGSIVSGLGLIAFGLAYPLNIHSMTYFLVIQFISGAAHTTGWPVVVTCVSNWFGPAKRGLIYGLWNSHTNLGNIIGATIAGFFVEQDWGLSFMVPGAIMVIVGIILFLFLVPTPPDVELCAEGEGEGEAGSLKAGQSSTTISSYDAGFDHPTKSQELTGSQTSHKKAVSFWTALKIPGVIEYSLCLFFAKLVSYTFLFWLPRYITSSTGKDSENSAYLSTPFDVGGIVGAIVAGHISDEYSASGITCNVMLILAIPAMFVYQKYGALSSMYNISIQLVVGALVNGPFCLITTAVSADLGNRIKDGRAMATVAAIIDGMGSIGAVIGPLFAGLVSNSGDWQAVFYMLMAADVLASLCLTRLTINEIKDKLSGPATSSSTLEAAP